MEAGLQLRAMTPATSLSPSGTSRPSGCDPFVDTVLVDISGSPPHIGRIGALHNPDSNSGYSFDYGALGNAAWGGLSHDDGERSTVKGLFAMLYGWVGLQVDETMGRVFYGRVRAHYGPTRVDEDEDYSDFYRPARCIPASDSGGETDRQEYPFHEVNRAWLSRVDEAIHQMLPSIYVQDYFESLRGSNRRACSTEDGCEPVDDQLNEIIRAYYTLATLVGRISLAMSDEHDPDGVLRQQLALVRNSILDTMHFTAYTLILQENEWFEQRYGEGN